MRNGFRLGIGAALALALFAGDLPNASFGSAPAEARDHYRGGYGGHRGGYRGGYGGRYYGGYGHRYYGGGFGFGDALLGAAIIGGTAAIISSANRPSYDSGYAYQTYPAPPAYAPGYAPAPPPEAYGAAGYDNGGDDGDASPPQYGANDPVEQCSRAAEREAQARGGFARVIGIDHVDNRQNGARVNGTLEIKSGSDGNGNAARTDRRGFVCTADYGQVTGLRIG